MIYSNLYCIRFGALSQVDSPKDIARPFINVLFALYWMKALLEKIYIPRLHLVSITFVRRWFFKNPTFCERTTEIRM
jgi:hypothetical protein